MRCCKSSAVYRQLSAIFTLSHRFLSGLVFVTWCDVYGFEGKCWLKLQLSFLLQLDSWVHSLSLWRHLVVSHELCWFWSRWNGFYLHVKQHPAYEWSAPSSGRDYGQICRSTRPLSRTTTIRTADWTFNNSSEVMNDKSIWGCVIDESSWF